MMMRKGLLGNGETLCDFDLRRPRMEVIAMNACQRDTPYSAQQYY
jgi:hypothetical protein